MNRSSVWILLLCTVQIVFAFSITNQLSIDNLTALPELITNISDSYIDISVDELNIGNANESLNLETRADLIVQSDQKNYSISPTTPDHNTYITTNEHWRASILKHQTRTSRSFFGLFIIPCQYTRLDFVLYSSRFYFPFFSIFNNFLIQKEKKKAFPIISFIILIILSLSLDIICFFAAKGFWPVFPSMLQYQVNEMGKKVFSQSDDRIRQFCCGKFNFQETCYRPGIESLAFCIWLERNTLSKWIFV